MKGFEFSKVLFVLVFVFDFGFDVYIIILVFCLLR